MIWLAAAWRSVSIRRSDQQHASPVGESRTEEHLSAVVIDGSGSGCQDGWRREACCRSCQVPNRAYAGNDRASTRHQSDQTMRPHVQARIGVTVLVIIRVQKRGERNLAR